MENQFEPLTKENVNTFIGKKIAFNAPGYETRYEGVAIIKSVDYSNHNPLECECISGDDLSYAFLDIHGLVSYDGGETYRITNENTCFSYSDGDREIFVKIL